MSEEKVAIEKIKRLQEFKNLKEFETDWIKYKNYVKQTFVIEDAHTLRSNPVEGANLDCYYKNVKYVCIYGNARHPFRDEKTSIRNTR